MKSTLLLASLLMITNSYAQKTKNMETETNTIQAIVTQIFVGTDERNWEDVENAFADQVLLDYTSMAGGEPSTLSPTQITDSWKTVLPGFEYTHHSLSNFRITINGSEAEVYHYGSAEHYIDVANGSDLWTVVGTYDHHLIKTNQGWKVDRMKFNLKYMDGNMDLPRIAQERVSGIEGDQSINIGERNKTTVKRFFSLLEQENIPAFIDLFAKNGKQVNPYASGIFPDGAEGKAALKAYWEPVPGNFDGMEFPIEEIYAMEDPSIVFVKYSGKIRLKNGGGYYENNYYSTFKFNSEGKITEYVEIFNPITAARGFGLLDQIK